MLIPLYRNPEGRFDGYLKLVDLYPGCECPTHDESVQCPPRSSLDIERAVRTCQEVYALIPNLDSQCIGTVSVVEQDIEKHGVGPFGCDEKFHHSGR